MTLNPLELGYDGKGYAHAVMYGADPTEGLVPSDAVAIHYKDGHMVVDAIGGKSLIEEAATPDDGQERDTVDYEAQLSEVAESLEGYEPEIDAIEQWIADQLDKQEKEKPAGFDEMKARIAELGRYLTEIAPTHQDRRLQEAALHMKHFEEIAQAAAKEERRDATVDEAPQLVAA